ncbi:alpha/beta fold hydrolase [Dyella acidiphila]|uniref:Alpha/beta hydrolase n=1 Tax=Dyella acidiphila TaxID=2775866 RepID=A0ABR9G9R4_9GAMM|nr:alpha/beta hydrolase [Dyella acidiphila]MBE1160774.1 alpha/beta hydrolase [Dyella acidiphila]
MMRRSISGAAHRTVFTWWLAVLALPWSVHAAPPPTSAPPVAAYLTPQRLVAIDDTRRLNLYCLGHGAPTVIFDSGTGGGTRDWRAVQGAIAAHTTACSYDRAGYGFSDAPTRASDAANAVDDLHRLVAKAALPVPLLLVGHSNGGIYAVLYARTYPQQVGGMVLVDPGFTGQQDFQRYGLAPEKVAELEQGNAQWVALAQHCLELARSGALAKSQNQSSPCLDNPPNPDPRLHAVLNHLEMQPGFFAAYLSEFQSTFVAEHGSTRNDRESPLSAHEFGAMPLVVLTAARHPAAWPDFTAQDQQKYFDYWKQSHDRLAALSTHGQSILVPNSGHFIQRDQPDTVIHYVLHVVDQVRKDLQYPSSQP